MSRTIWVYENWSSINPILLGRLYVDGDKRTEKFSFEYDDKWLLNNGAGITLDPELYLYRGRQYTPLGKQLFGLFSDSCPDRWGRLLLQRREAINARKENLRNHGFIYTPQGWCLSPLYDVNPVPYGDNLSLMVDDKESTVDVDLALETAQYYDIDLHEAKSIAADMFRIVKDNWRELAKNNGLSRNAIEKMYAAFSMVEK